MTNTISDAVAAAQEAEDAGVAELRRLRDEHAALTAEQDAARQAVEAELATAEAAFARLEAERVHAEQLVSRREQHTAAKRDYAAAQNTAAAALAEVERLATEAADAFKAAIEAETARRAAGNALRTTAANLHSISPNEGTEPNIGETPSALWLRTSRNHLLGVQHTAVQRHEHLEHEIWQLAGNNFRRWSLDVAPHVRIG